MHMPDCLVSPEVGAAMFAASAAGIAYSVGKIKADGLCDRKIAVTGALGAVVFASQMINFGIPSTGASGHIGGGLLLAALVGAYPAMIAMSAVLALQCLVFADGGLLALGANIFNLGVIPCLIVYPLVFKPLAGRGSAGRTAFAAMIAAMAGLQIGAFAVALQTLASGVDGLPFTSFAPMMQAIHLAIGLFEGLITAGVVYAVCKARPEIAASAAGGTALSGVPVKRLVTALAVAALAVGGALSLAASSAPDGLEWSMAKVAGAAELEISSPFVTGLASLQESIAFMPDYGFRGSEGMAGTAAAGVVGVALAFALAWAAAFAVSRGKRLRAVPLR